MADAAIRTEQDERDAARHRLNDVDFAATRTGLPRWRIYSEAAAGRLPCRVVGRRLFFTVADLDAYVERIQRRVSEAIGA